MQQRNPWGDTSAGPGGPADEDWPAVAAASRRVVQEAEDAGVWVFGGGIQRQRASVVSPEGTVTPGPFFFIFPFSARRSRPNLDPFPLWLAPFPRSSPSPDPFPLRLAPFPVQPQSRPFPVTV